MSKVEAVGFRVVVKPDPIEEKTQGGIVLAINEKMEKNACTSGVVVSVGPEAFRAYNKAAGFAQYVPWVKVGDRISYAKYAGKWVDFEGEELLVLNDEDIVARLNSDRTDNVEA